MPARLPFTFHAWITRRAAARLLAVLLSLGVLMGALRPAFALSLIRDAETEELLRTYATPIFAAAGLNPRSVNIYLVQDNQINAFVAGGQNVFFTTELLLEFNSPAEIKGVIAHEVGHIAGGHLARAQDAMKGSGALAIASLVLGMGAAAMGQADVGMGIMTGGMQVAQRNYLAYGRSQESSADQAGASFLEATGQSAAGLLEVMHRFSGQEALNAPNQDPYVLTHPMGSDRIRSLEDRLESSPFRDQKEPPELIEAHLRMQGKLYGFIKPYAQTFRKFPAKDTSVKARYARAIAHYRRGDTEEGLKEVDLLIAEDPRNPYYYELKGQILFENGRAREAIAPHARAVGLKPDIPLLRVNLAQAMLSSEDKAFQKPAKESLELAMRQDPEITFGWHQLAIAYANEGQEGMAALASAERSFRSDDRRDAYIHSQRAMKMLPVGSPGNFRAQDIYDMVKPKHRGDFIE
ncbi:MAG: M48 family peptidase [Alphaproteobacteria bacterium]|nr:M48 family peptidase [Alphaproteobacteria bacterium]